MTTASVRKLRNHFSQVSPWAKAGREAIASGKKSVARPATIPAPPRLQLFVLQEHEKRMTELYGEEMPTANPVLTMRPDDRG